MLYRYLNEDGPYKDKTTGEKRNLISANAIACSSEEQEQWEEFKTEDLAMEYFNIEKVGTEN